MSRSLKWFTAALGLWLIVEISVFGAGVALWIAFATSIGIASLGVIDFGIAVARRDALSATGAVVTVLLAAFLIVASFVFDGASMSWLMVTAGGVVEALALVAIALSGRRRSAGVIAVPDASSREEIRQAA